MIGQKDSRSKPQIKEAKLCLFEKEKGFPQEASPMGAALWNNLGIFN